MLNGNNNEKKKYSLPELGLDQISVTGIRPNDVPYVKTQKKQHDIRCISALLLTQMWWWSGPLEEVQLVLHLHMGQPANALTHLHNINVYVHKKQG